MNGVAPHNLYIVTILWEKNHCNKTNIPRSTTGASLMHLEFALKIFYTSRLQVISLIFGTEILPSWLGCL